jgi:hypothetical protein
VSGEDVESGLGEEGDVGTVNEEHKSNPAIFQSPALFTKILAMHKLP